MCKDTFIDREKCDKLQEDLESDMQLIIDLSINVTQANEEYKELCAELDKKWELQYYSSVKAHNYIYII